MPYVHQPNVILCLFDSFSEIGNGCSYDKSQLTTLTKLRSASLRCTRAYTPCPESSPAKASLFTGLDPCVHGLWTNGVTLKDSERTFTQRLSQTGYASYLAGRYQLSGVSRWTTEHCRKGEFNRFDWAHGPMHRSRQNAYLNWLKKISPHHYATLFNEQTNPDSTMITSQQRARLEALPDENINLWDDPDHSQIRSRLINEILNWKLESSLKMQGLIEACKDDEGAMMSPPGRAARGQHREGSR